MPQSHPGAQHRPEAATAEPSPLYVPARKGTGAVSWVGSGLPGTGKSVGPTQGWHCHTRVPSAATPGGAWQVPRPWPPLAGSPYAAQLPVEPETTCGDRDNLWSMPHIPMLPQGWQPQPHAPPFYCSIAPYLFRASQPSSDVFSWRAPTGVRGPSAPAALYLLYCCSTRHSVWYLSALYLFGTVIS